MTPTPRPIEGVWRHRATDYNGGFIDTPHRCTITAYSDRSYRIVVAQTREVKIVRRRNVVARNYQPHEIGLGVGRDVSNNRLPYKD